MIGFFLILLTHPLQSQPHKRISFGLYGGKSFGMGYTFEWHRRPYSDRSQIDFFAGAYVQYNFIPELGLQFNVNYQRGVYEWVKRK